MTGVVLLCAVLLLLQWLHAKSLQLRNKQRHHVRHPDQQQQQ
jgi:hypothetical protein